ncbi:uncharacterized protein LOC105181691 [Harpegnathos saltator]|uniref:uncharacterized protein LOC105181691 n=1 Tax=Harpegnathos saltator TaxID=610380 RepID=UPI0005904E66|nr:uncharacterized protein LOC105181691 [Harpegnathos saltator]
MLFHVLSIFGILVFEFCAAEKLHLPVSTCERNTTDYSSCLKHAIQEAWPLFVKGLPSEFEFPPLDPLLFEYQDAEFDNDYIQGKISVFNITIKGMSAARFVAVRPHFYDKTDFRLKIMLRIPTITLYGKYKAHGTLGGFLMTEEGKLNISLENLKITWDISGPVKDDTWIINQFFLNTLLQKLKIKLDDGNNREMNDLITLFINEFWPLLYRRVIIPIAGPYWNSYCSNLSNRLFSKLSFSEIFP